MWLFERLWLLVRLCLPRLGGGGGEALDKVLRLLVDESDPELSDRVDESQSELSEEEGVDRRGGGGEAFLVRVCFFFRRGGRA